MRSCDDKGDIRSSRRRVRAAAWLTALGVIAVSQAGIQGAGIATASTATATASPGQRTLHGTCSFPVIGDEQVSAVVRWNGPTSVPADVSTPRLPFTVAIPVPAIGTWLGHFLGAAAFDGVSSVNAVVVAPQGDVDRTVTLTVPKTALPASGAFNVTATGTLPSVVLTKPGIARITVHTVTVHITLLTAGGGPIFFYSHITTTCTLDPGESSLITSVRITAPVASRG